LQDRIKAIFEQSSKTRDQFLSEGLEDLILATEALIETIKAGGAIYLFGNGGSAADAQHIAAEFVNRYILERRPLPAIALTTDSSVMTSIANDYDYDEIFAKQIRALAKPGDLAIGISTSGGSRNVVRGLEAAKETQLITIGLGGPKDAPMSHICDYYLSVRGPTASRIQETHEIIGHAMVEISEAQIFGDEL
jgi:D-sedoheptulose 7-phosphate isomerase